MAMLRIVVATAKCLCLDRIRLWMRYGAAKVASENEHSILEKMRFSGD